MMEGGRNPNQQTRSWRKESIGRQGRQAIPHIHQRGTGPNRPNSVLKVCQRNPTSEVLQKAGAVGGINLNQYRYVHFCNQPAVHSQQYNSIGPWLRRDLDNPLARRSSVEACFCIMPYGIRVRLLQLCNQQAKSWARLSQNSNVSSQSFRMCQFPNSKAASFLPPASCRSQPKVRTRVLQRRRARASKIRTPPPRSRNPRKGDHWPYLRHHYCSSALNEGRYVLLGGPKPRAEHPADCQAYHVYYLHQMGCWTSCQNEMR